MPSTHFPFSNRFLEVPIYYNSDVCDDLYNNTGWGRTTAQLTADTAISDLGFDSSKWSKTANTSEYLCYPDLTNVDGDQPSEKNSVPAPTNVKAVAGATKYLIKNGGSTVLASNITGTSKTFTGLTNGTTYKYTLFAYVGGTWSGASAAVSATPSA